jgi:hypothetical protein
MRELKVVVTAAILLLLAAGSALGQADAKANLGLRAGVSSSFVEVTGAGTSSKVGFVGGGQVALPLGDVSVELDVLYSQKGFKKTTTSDYTNWEAKFNYLDFPLMARYDTDLSDATDLFFYGGFLGGILLSANHKADETNLEWVDVKDKLPTMNWGLVFGLGLEYMGAFVDLRYNHGLTNLNKEFPTLAEIRDRTLQLMIGYAWGETGE